MHFRLPQLLARLAVVAKHRLGALLLVGGGEINVPSDDGWRTVPASWNGALPGDVLRCAPLGRRILVGVRDAVALGPAPPRPVGGIHGNSVVDLLAETWQWKQRRGSGNDNSAHDKGAKE